MVSKNLLEKIICYRVFSEPYAKNFKKVYCKKVFFEYVKSFVHKSIIHSRNFIIKAVGLQLYLFFDSLNIFQVLNDNLLKMVKLYYWIIYVRSYTNNWILDLKILVYCG